MEDYLDEKTRKKIKELEKKQVVGMDEFKKNAEELKEKERSFEKKFNIGKKK